MKFEAIRKDRMSIPVSWKCAALGVTEQGYYAHCRRALHPTPRENEDAALTAAITDAHRVSRQTYGTPRLRTALAAQGYRTSRRRIGRLLVGAGLYVRRRRKFVRTTNSEHSQPVFPNRLNRAFIAMAPNQVWVSDITYIRVASHWLYLCTVIDLFGNVVVGRKLSSAIDATLVTNALRMAIASRRPPKGCMFHSDRGSQYASEDVTELARKYGLQQSMSRKANCWDNAVAESSFARLKTELGDEFESDAEAVRNIYEYLDVFHNHIRIYSRINTTPVNYEYQYWKNN